MVLFLLNIISHNALNLYGAVLSIITSIQTFASQWTPSIKVRVVLSSVVLAGCCVVALGASADFISEFIGLILALLLVLVPWASINLIDFYLIKRGMLRHRLDLPRRWRDLRALQSARDHCVFHWHYVQLPFANTSLYVGPYANLVDGADLSWLVGLVVTVARCITAWRHAGRLSRARRRDWVTPTELIRYPTMPGQVPGIVVSASRRSIKLATSIPFWPIPHCAAATLSARIKTTTRRSTLFTLGYLYSRCRV
jgi:hypothetical protein